MFGTLPRLGERRELSTGNKVFERLKPLLNSTLSVAPRRNHVGAKWSAAYFRWAYLRINRLNPAAPIASWVPASLVIRWWNGAQLQARLVPHCWLAVGVAVAIGNRQGLGFLPPGRGSGREADLEFLERLMAPPPLAEVEEMARSLADTQESYFSPSLSRPP